MNCLSCHRSNESHCRYCGGCGTRLTVICARCSFVNPLTNAFCSGCADRLDPSALKLETVKEPTASANVLRQGTASGDLSKTDMAELLTVRRAQFEATSSPKVSQDDLDKLFAKT